MENKSLRRCLYSAVATARDGKCHNVHFYINSIYCISIRIGLVNCSRSPFQHRSMHWLHSCYRHAYQGQDRNVPSFWRACMHHWCMSVLSADLWTLVKLPVSVCSCLLLHLKQLPYKMNLSDQVQRQQLAAHLQHLISVFLKDRFRMTLTVCVFVCVCYRVPLRRSSG